jgi:signal peptidase I
MAEAPPTGASTAPAAATTPPTSPWEAGQPGWQRGINQFCENWLFAFVVAMAIRSFVVEAFTIPSASMEPMLYGDPGFFHGDHVLVDKLSLRFTGLHRWDVTVFQFPEPELEPPPGSGLQTASAIDRDGNRLDVPLLKPLLYRNFVKRCVILPGDTFYIANGNVYLKQPDGTFKAARKPDGVQAAVWQEIYRHGEQPDYQPWEATGGCAITPPTTPATAPGAAAAAPRLALTLAADGAVTFTQPFRNLYVKPGPIAVRRDPSNDPPQVVNVALTAPQFSYAVGERTITGSIWDFDHWKVIRLTSADLDSGHYTSEINNLQNEWVGDIRVEATLASLDGSAAIELAHGKQQGERLVCDGAGWHLDGLGDLTGKLSASGPSALGHRVGLIHLDDEVQVTIDGAIAFRQDVPVVNPFLQRTSLRFTGAGHVAWDGLHLSRDIHYTGNYALIDGYQQVAKCQSDFQKASDAGQDAVADYAKFMESNIYRVRQQFAPELGEQSTRAIACSPETAVTAPPGAYLMLGDNSPHSWDGRAWGWVPAENIRGRAWLVIMPRWHVVR